MAQTAQVMLSTWNRELQKRTIANTSWQGNRQTLFTWEWEGGMVVVVVVYVGGKYNKQGTEDNNLQDNLNFF